MSIMAASLNTAQVRIVTTVVAVLTLGLAQCRSDGECVATGALPAQDADLGDCNLSMATTPCFETIWADGAQVKMTFVDLTPARLDPSDVNFYVLAPQTGAPQGGPAPFFHDHVTADTRSALARTDAGIRELDVHYHGFLVLCSAQGLSGGACVPTMTSTPDGMVPFARTVGGNGLTSVDRIEAAATSGLLTLVDTNSVFVARIDHETPGGCE